MEYPASRSSPSSDLSRLVHRLRLKHWALLAAIAECGTLNKAAAQLSVTQPSATKLLADVEEAMGFAVFERHARGLRPTPLGREVLAYAQQAQAGLSRFASDMEIKRRGGHGQLVFGAIMGAAPDLVALAVARIKRERPLLNVRIVGETSDQIGVLLDRGEIEMVVGRLSDPAQRERTDFLPLANEVLEIVARAGHPLSKEHRLELAALADWPWVLQPATSPARRLLEEAFGEARVSTPANRVECSSIFATLQLLQATDAVALLPEAVVRDHVKARLLTVLPLRLEKSLPGFGVLTRRGEALSEAAQAFIGCLQEAAQGVG